VLVFPFDGICPPYGDDIHREIYQYFPHQYRFGILFRTTNKDVALLLLEAVFGRGEDYEISESLRIQDFAYPH